ncbi:hypothetical protein ACLK2C_10085 [Escherichia coli]
MNHLFSRWGNTLDMVGLCALLVALGIVRSCRVWFAGRSISHLEKVRMSRQDIHDEFRTEVKAESAR